MQLKSPTTGVKSLSQLRGEALAAGAPPAQVDAIFALLMDVPAESMVNKLEAELERSQAYQLLISLAASHQPVHALQTATKPFPDLPSEQDMPKKTFLLPEPHRKVPKPAPIQAETILEGLWGDKPAPALVKQEPIAQSNDFDYLY